MFKLHRFKESYPSERWWNSNLNSYQFRWLLEEALKIR